MKPFSKLHNRKHQTELHQKNLKSRQLSNFCMLESIKALLNSLEGVALSACPALVSMFCFQCYQGQWIFRKFFCALRKWLDQKNVRSILKIGNANATVFLKISPFGLSLPTIPISTGPTLAAFQQSSPPHFPEGHHVACLDNMRFFTPHLDTENTDVFRNWKVEFFWTAGCFFFAS